MLVWNKSTDTTKDLATIDTMTNLQAKPYTQSKEDELIVWYIARRKQEMATKRKVIDKYWSQFVKQFEALFIPYNDWRSASNVPLERAIIELYVAEALKRPTNFNFDWWIEYEFQANVFEKVWEHIWSTWNFNSEILDNEYLTAIFWTSIIYNWYSKTYRIIEDFEWIDDDEDIIYQKKIETKAEIFMKNIDIRNFWIDDKAKKPDDAIDCIYEIYLSYEEFSNLYLDNGYSDEVLSAIMPTKNRYDEYRPFTVQEEEWEWEQRYVKITRYWNTKIDRCYEVANDAYLIKETPILNASHSIPFTIRQYGKNPFSVYGYWLCEALLTFKSDINTLRELIMEAIKKSNQEIIALWNWLSFDWNQFAFDNQFLKFSWNLQWNFQQLSWTPPNQAIFSRLQDLFKEIAIFTGIDIMNIIWEPQQTAYQTAVQKESSLQRVNVVLKNRDAAFEWLADKLKDDIQMFYPIKLVRKLVNINDKWEKEDQEKEYPSIEAPKVKWKSFSNNWELEMFEISPERIRWNIKVEVSTDLNVWTIHEVEKAQKMEFYQWIAILSQAYAADKTLEEIMPKRKAIEDLAKLNNINIVEAKWSEIKQEKKALYSELQTMMQWINTPSSWPNMDAALPEWQAPADVAPEWQVPEIANVSTPNI